MDGIEGPRANEWRKATKDDLNGIKEIVERKELPDEVMVYVDNRQNEIDQLSKAFFELKKRRMAENPEMWHYLYNTFKVTEVNNNGMEQHSTRSDKSTRTRNNIQERKEGFDTNSSTQRSVNENTRRMVEQEAQEIKQPRDKRDKSADRKPVSRSGGHRGRPRKARQHKRSPDQRGPDSAGPVEEVRTDEAGGRDIDYAEHDAEKQGAGDDRDDTEVAE